MLRKHGTLAYFCLLKSIWNGTNQCSWHLPSGSTVQDPAKPVYLKNVWGKGYIFQPEGEKA